MHSVPGGSDSGTLRIRAGTLAEVLGRFRPGHSHVDPLSFQIDIAERPREADLFCARYPPVVRNETGVLNRLKHPNAFDTSNRCLTFYLYWLPISTARSCRAPAHRPKWIRASYSLPPFRFFRSNAELAFQSLTAATPIDRLFPRHQG